MADNVRTVAAGAASMGGSLQTIATISAEAQTTTSGVLDIKQATEELSGLSKGLRALVGQFRV